MQHKNELRDRRLEKLLQNVHHLKCCEEAKAEQEEAKTPNSESKPDFNCSKFQLDEQQQQNDST